LTMRESLLVLAANADWLAGKPVTEATPGRPTKLQ